MAIDMTGWIVLGGILLFLALILSLSIVIRVHVGSEGFRVWIGAGPFGKGILPAAEKQEEEPSQEPKKAKKSKKSSKKASRKKKDGEKPDEEHQKEHQKGDVAAMVKLALEAAKGALPPLGKLLSGFRLTDLRLYLRVGGPDAAQAAIRYGQVCAVVHGSLATLKSFMRISVTDIGIGYDFLENGIQEDVSFKLKLRLGHALGQGLRLLGRVLWRVVRAMLKQGKSPFKQKAKPADTGLKKQEE